MIKCEVCGKKITPVIRLKTCSNKCRSKKHYNLTKTNKKEATKRMGEKAHGNNH